jgi:hypothetical protein
MKKILLPVLIVILVFLTFQIYGEYNKDAVVKTMRNNLAQMKAMKAAASKSDFDAAAEAIWSLADGMKSVRGLTPLKGTKEAWVKMIDELVVAAYKGIGACGEKNIEKLNQSIAELGSFSKKGHGQFRIKK